MEPTRGMQDRRKAKANLNENDWSMGGEGGGGGGATHEPGERRAVGELRAEQVSEMDWQQRRGGRRRRRRRRRRRGLLGAVPVA
jgi:hypothetical protein